MAQVRNIARITKLKTKTIPMQITDERKQMTPMTKTTRPVNQGFQKYLLERSNKAQSLRDIIEVALAEIEQPVSTNEMCFYLKKEANLDIKEMIVKYALDQLAGSGKAARHLETDKERKLRANGVPVTPRPAHLFNSGTKARVRTEAVAVDGYVMTDPRNNTGRPKTSKNKSSLPKVHTSTQTGTSKTGSPLKVVYTNQTGKSPFDTSAVDYLIEKIVEERTRELRRQLDEAIAQLQHVKNILQS